MSTKLPSITCLFCGDLVPENKVEIRKIKVPGVTRKQIVHSTDCCTLLNLGFKDVIEKKQNCYRRHQDFKKRLYIAMESNNPELAKFARKCLWQMIERKPTKYLNKQLTAIRPQIDDELIYKKFRNFWKKPCRKVVVMVQ